MLISVQTEDFDLSHIIKSMTQGRQDIGAITSFIGLVRDLASNDLISMTLEHYPGMTESALEDIAKQAESRWDIQDVAVIHRYGELFAAEQIVLVAVASQHRSEAFQACEFIMDYLKTSAPFWKKEKTQQGESWVEAKETDDEAKARWDLKK